MGHLAIERWAPDWAGLCVPWCDLRFEIKLALFTAVVLPVSLAATYLTAPVARAKLETFYRILSFMALGVVLLVLGYIYSRYQEKIKEWL